MLQEQNGYGNDDSQAQSISQALNVTLDPSVGNDLRRQALEHLELFKTRADAPYHGYALASEPQSPQAVRYFGLQLLEYAVRYQWSQYDESQTEQLRIWILTLAHSINEHDPAFYRNKIGQIWVECAKRSWGETWNDMDAQLCKIWEDTAANKQPANRLLVLHILETLAEDICSREDATAGLRLEVLGSALNEIVIPREVYKVHSEVRAKDRTFDARQGDEGWLARICTFVAECVKQLMLDGGRGSATAKLCATNGLNALKAFVAWLSLKAVTEVNCVSCLSMSLHIDDVNIKVAAVETMLTILSRPPNPHFNAEVIRILQHVLQIDSIALLGATFQQDRFMPSNDGDSYLLQKKTSDLLSVVADALLSHGTQHFQPDAIDAFFNLSIGVFQNQSLVVSIPILHSWTRLMASRDEKLVSLVMQALGTLVDVCSQRLLNFEMLGEDDESTIVQFLYQDFESAPERHAFLGNYRRYSIAVIETISRQRPLDAITHVFGAMQSMLESGRYTTAGFEVASYSESALPVLQFDAQFTVAIAVVKGYLAWEKDAAAMAQDDPARADADVNEQSARQALHDWCLSALDTRIDDPEVVSHVITLVSSITRNTQTGTDIVLRVVQYLLSTHLESHPNATAYTDSCKGFEALRTLEIQKIALVFVDDLFNYYHELEDKVNEIVRLYTGDDRLVWGLKAFLFIILQRTSLVNEHVRIDRLRGMIDPIISAWTSRTLQEAVTSTDAFCEYVGLGDLPSFYQQHGFAQTEDWAARQLSNEGQDRQAAIKSGLDRLPLRMTKSLLGATTEQLKDDSNEYSVACVLWEGNVQAILPALLQMIRHSQSYSNLDRWTSWPPEIQAVIKRTLQDRFWQSGISNESRDDFYKRISGSKSSYEGFASTVRGTVRNIREQAYHILFLFTRFEEQFYGFADLPEPLSEALFENADCLSTHHLQPVINLATGLIQRCPPQYRRRFLPPLLQAFFAKLDKKISSEWDLLSTTNTDTAESEELSEEMRIESVLRQLTYSMVSFVAFLLEFDKSVAGKAKSLQGPLLTEVVLSDVSILEPLILFCTHALRMRDTRCCTLICKILCNLVPQFAVEAEPAPRVREFISTEVFKAGITSLNEPYFADMQKDLASLLAQILLLYSPRTSTPRSVLLTLPGLEVDKVDSALRKLQRSKSAREQRALVLVLLESLRGVSIHESGKIARQDKKPKVNAQYMEVEQKPSITHGDDAGLDGIGDLFGDA